MEEPKIKPQLKLLVLNYVGKCAGNMKKSAIEAGYSENYANKQSYKLVEREDVKKYIEYLRQKNSVEVDIMTVQEVQKFWSDLIKDKGAHDRDRLRASELLAKAQGQFSNDW